MRKFAHERIGVNFERDATIRPACGEPAISCSNKFSLDDRSYANPNANSSSSSARKRLRFACVLLPSAQGAPSQQPSFIELEMPKKESVYDEPSDVRAVDGAVELDGPDAVDLTISAEAAEETSERLLVESMKARGQRRLKRYPHQPHKG